MVSVSPRSLVSHAGNLSRTDSNQNLLFQEKPLNSLDWLAGTPLVESIIAEPPHAQNDEVFTVDGDHSNDGSTSLWFQDNEMGNTTELPSTDGSTSLWFQDNEMRNTTELPSTNADEYFTTSQRALIADALRKTDPNASLSGDEAFLLEEDMGEDDKRIIEGIMLGEGYAMVAPENKLSEPDYEIIDSENMPIDSIGSAQKGSSGLNGLFQIGKNVASFLQTASNTPSQKSFNSGMKGEGAGW